MSNRQYFSTFFLFSIAGTVSFVSLPFVAWSAPTNNNTEVDSVQTALAGSPSGDSPSGDSPSIDIAQIDIAQIPDGPPSEPPNPPPTPPSRPPSGMPVPEPIIELPESPDPFLDFPGDPRSQETLPIDRSLEEPAILEIDDSAISTIERDWPGVPLAASGALTEESILAGFLPEPMLTIALPKGENNTAAGTQPAANTISAAVQPNEGEVQPTEAVDIGEPGINPEPPEESPENSPAEPPDGAAEGPLEEASLGEVPPGDTTPEEASPTSAQSETENTSSTALSNGEASGASFLDCQAQVNDLSAVETAGENPQAVYQSLAVCYQQNLDKAIATQNKTQEILSLNNLAVAQFVLGNYIKAQELHERQLTEAQSQGDTVQTGIARAGLGATLAALGDYSGAIAHYQDSLPLLSSSTASNTVQWRSLTLRNLGNAYYAQQNFEQAEAYQQQSLQLSQSVGDRYGEMQALGNLGNLQSSSNEIEAAIATYRQALTLAKSLRQSNEEAQILLGLGTAYYYLQNYETAYEYYKQSLSLTRQLGAQLGEGIALTNLGEILLRQKRFSEAETALSKGIEIWESLQAGLGNNDALKVSLFETQRAAYRNLQEVLINSNRASTALEISERGRARAFVELLARGDIEAAQTEVAAIAPPTLAQLQQTAIAKQITLVEYAIIRDQFTNLPHGASPQQSAASVSQQPEAAELYIWVIQPTGEIDFRQVALRSLSLPIAQLVEESRAQLKTSGASRIAATQRANSQPSDINTLRPGDFVRRQGDPATWEPYEVIAINPDTNTVSVTHPTITLPNPNLPIAELLTVEPSATLPVSSTVNSQPALQQLHKLLIEPIADLLPTNTDEPVVFIPQEQLFLIPFAALQNPEGQDLIDQHTILTAPSIQALSLIEPSTTPRQQNPLIVGNPSPMPQSLAPLPYAQTEAEAIGQNLSASPLIQSAATESTIKQQLSTAGLIHLATHGFFNESNPFQGSLALAPDGSQEDGFLTVAEILEQPLTAQLVILSACDTGRGRITGDGVVGFSRSFLAAGAARVIVSLWQVPDEATSSLMVEFYQQLQQGQSEAQALRQAMLITRETYPNPHDWAAFTFTGDNRPSQ